MQDVPLSDVIAWRVANMSSDILDQVCYEIKDNPARISLQLDASTDSSHMIQLNVYIWYVKDGEIKDKFLVCKALQTTQKEVDVF